MRIIVIGDELAAGVGDTRCLGWIGRVVARCPVEEPAYIANLAIPGLDSTALAHRWRSECEARLNHQEDCRLVIGLGAGDARSGLSTARSRLNLANIMDAAAEMNLRTLVVGPPPLPHCGDIHQLSRAYEDVANRRHVPFINTVDPLNDHEQWHADVQAHGGRHPGQIGYGLMAWLVLHQGWPAWMGVVE